MDGPKTILITGSTDGVGRRVAERLARPGVRLLIHGRDRGRGDAVVSTLRAAGAEAVFRPADFSSLDEVKAFAASVRDSEPRLDVLINNAGIGTAGPSRVLSRDGYELRFAVNYLSGFVLSRLLLPLLRRSAPSRIVDVSSAGQQELDFSDLMLERGYSGVRAYRQSKLAQILMTIDLAEELKATGVTVNALHPATYMDTTMVRAAGATPASTVDEGAEAILQLVQSPDLEGRSGLYFDRLRESRANAQAYDAEARRRLRAASFELTGLAPGA